MQLDALTFDTADPAAARKGLSLAVCLMLAEQDRPHGIALDAQGRARVYPSGAPGDPAACPGGEPYRVLTDTAALVSHATGLAGLLQIRLPEPSKAAEWAYLAALVAGDLIEDLERLSQELAHPAAPHPAAPHPAAPHRAGAAGD